MIINKDGKLFGKVSIIDMLVILIIAAAALGIGIRYVSQAAKDARAVTKFEYTIEISNIRKYTVDALNKKGIVTDLKSDSVVGEVSEVKSRPMKIQTVDKNGNATVAEVPEKYVATVTITADGHESNRGYFVGNDIELSVGTTLQLTTKYVNTTGKVLDIKKGN